MRPSRNEKIRCFYYKMDHCTSLPSTSTIAPECSGHRSWETARVSCSCHTRLSTGYPMVLGVDPFPALTHSGISGSMFERIAFKVVHIFLQDFILFVEIQIYNEGTEKRRCG